MTTAIALDPVAELEQALGPRDGVEPCITMTDDMALVSYTRGGHLRTEIWLRGEHGWQKRGVHAG
jgi:hypothetical protein